MLDLFEHSVTKDGQPVSLTVIEFRLLQVLMTHAGRVVPTSTLLHEVWSVKDEEGSDYPVQVAVHSLRRKLDQDTSQPKLLQIIPGVGVLLAPM